MVTFSIRARTLTYSSSVDSSSQAIRYTFVVALFSCLGSHVSRIIPEVNSPGLAEGVDSGNGSVDAVFGDAVSADNDDVDDVSEFWVFVGGRDGVDGLRTGHGDFESALNDWVGTLINFFDTFVGVCGSIFGDSLGAS